MIALTEDVNKLFNDVLQEISHNVRDMMFELWLNWSHLGVDNSIKFNNITKLVQIEKDLHRDVILETRQKLETLQGQVDKLKQETEEVSRCLSVDITIPEFKDEMMLSDYKKDLEEQIAGYREQVEQRRMKMERLFEWQRDLADKLGVTITELKEVPLPSEEELDQLKEHLDVLQAERDKRAEIFLTAQMEIKDIMEKLQIKPQHKFEHIVVSSLSVDFNVTDLNMDRLAKLRQDLQEKYELTNNRVLELRERLTKLWDCLEEDRIYRESFLQSHQGCHMQTETALREEIRRCDQIKRQKIQVFVANVRTKIKHMWDNCMYSTKEREEFVHYYQDIFSEDTLTLHELYLEKITKFYNMHKQIFEMVATRKSLWSKMCELEGRATEPGRYHNRGGQLLKEEKERRAIASNLPKIEAQLRELVNEYEAKSGNTFTIDGKPLLQYITDEWETRKMERQSKLSARKQLLTPNTAMFRSLATSPLGKRNRTAAGLAATAEKNRPPSKRQHITKSATEADVKQPPPSKRQHITKSATEADVKQPPSSKRRLITKGATEADAKQAPPSKRQLTTKTVTETVHEFVKPAPPTKRQLVTGSATKPVTTFANNLSALKRTAVTSVKRRLSGRLAARALPVSAAANAKRKLDYDVDHKKTPKIKVNASILKHKRTSAGKRRSGGGRRSVTSRSNTSSSQDGTARKDKDALMESTLLTTYTDFKDGINEKQISRSSLASKAQENLILPTIVCQTIEEQNTPTSKKTPMTPKIGKENIQHLNVQMTPKSNLLCTPTRLTRSALKLNNDGFATPRAPLSANKANVQRQNTGMNLQVKTTPNNLSRSKTHSHLIRAKNLPPLI